MILSPQSIRDRKIIKPFNDKGERIRGMSYGLSHCGYDIRANLAELEPWPKYRNALVDGVSGIILEPGQFILIACVEHFEMPVDVVGIIHPKSTWSRQGLFPASAVLEPGWRGHMSLGVANHGAEDLTIVDGDPIAQVLFHYLDFDTESTYHGKYQGAGKKAQGPRFDA